MTRLVFNLKVSYYSEDNQCVFILWDHTRDDISVSQAYPDALQRAYQDWRSQYLTFYQLKAKKPVPRGRAITFVPTGDPARDVRLAEQRLLATFYGWLRNGETQSLQDRLKTALQQSPPHQAAAAPPTIAGGKPPEPEAGIDLYLNCDPALARLPWEAWAASLVGDGQSRQAMRLMRTGEVRAPAAVGQKRVGKSRVLAVLAGDARLSVEDDWDALKSLQPAIALERVELLPTDTAEQAVKKLKEKITDDRGWDLLYFAGHSDSTVLDGGTFALSPTLKLSIRDIKDYLEQARRQGLQLALFNSCCGLEIGRELVQLGIQALVMREPVRNDAAVFLLKAICQPLGQHQDMATVLSGVCQNPAIEATVQFPSIFLVPSLFGLPAVENFRIRVPRLQQLLAQWQPSKGQIGLLLLACFLSVFAPTRSLLLEWRLLNQAFLQQGINGISSLIPGEDQSASREPPITILEIDQDSIDRAYQTLGMADIETRPIDREYLSKLINKLAESNVSVVGLNYILDSGGRGGSDLADAIARFTEEKSGNLIFSTSGVKLPAANKFIDPAYHLEGYSDFWLWKVEPPRLLDCPEKEEFIPCSFAYLLAIAHQLNESSPEDQLTAILDTLPVEAAAAPDNQSPREIQARFSDFLNRQNLPPEINTIKQQGSSIFRHFFLLDLSIPPNEVYELIPAWQFLEGEAQDVDFYNSNTIIIVGAGEYEGLEQIQALPWAIRYWRYVHSLRSSPSENGNPLEKRYESFSNSEAQAYMVYQFFNDHQVIEIPPLLMVLLAGLIGKGIQIWRVSLPRKKRHKVMSALVLSIGLFGLASVQLYVLAKVCIPWLLPSGVLFYYSRRQLR